MNQPGSSISVLVPFTSQFPYEKCQICDQKAHGKHFGALTCRACAAFFRRVGATNSVKPCKNSNDCTFLKSGWFRCKKCRLDKCWKVGMTVDNFQYYRESNTLSTSLKIPQTINTLLGETNLIIFSTTVKKNKQKPKNYVNVEFLVEKARNVLGKGVESPILLDNFRVLNKLAFGLQKVRGNSRTVSKIITKVGREEVMAFWQRDVLRVAQWLTYFDAFKQLPDNLQLTLLKSMWHMWCRLEHVAHTALGRRLELCQFNQVMTSTGSQTFIADLNQLELDLSWCTEFTLEQLRFFIPDDFNHSETLVEMMVDANPTDEELSYLLCQICFHYVKKKHHGSEIINVVDQFQEILANDLHDYYVKERAMPRYCGRLTKLMKINNKLHEIFYREKVRNELAIVFDVFNIEFSHPEMFRDGWEIDS